MGTLPTGTHTYTLGEPQTTVTQTTVSKPDVNVHVKADPTSHVHIGGIVAPQQSVSTSTVTKTAPTFTTNIDPQAAAVFNQLFGLQHLQFESPIQFGFRRPTSQVTSAVNNVNWNMNTNPKGADIIIPGTVQNVPDAFGQGGKSTEVIKLPLLDNLHFVVL